MSARKKSDIEQLQNTPKDKSYWESHICEAVREFYLTEFNAETAEQIAKCSQNSFVSACEYARRTCISRADLMEYEPHTIHSTGAVVNNERYNSEVIEILCNVYLSLCFYYDKVPSVFGFSVLSGVDRQLLEAWGKDAQGVSIAYRADRQKAIQNIKAARAVSLQNVAITGGKNVVGCLAVLNNEFWGKNDFTPDSKRSLSLAELPDLSYPHFQIDDKSGSSAPMGDAVGVPVAGLPVLGANTDI